MASLHGLLQILSRVSTLTSFDDGLWPESCKLENPFPPQVTFGSAVLSHNRNPNQDNDQRWGVSDTFPMLSTFNCHPKSKSTHTEIMKFKL